MTEKELSSYDATIHRNGRIWMVLALLVTESVPLLISIHYHAWPPFTTFLQGFLPTIMVFWPIALVEVATFTPMLGSGGTYLAFVTGNLSNLKVPCAISAMEQAGVEPSTKEGEIISTLAIGASSLVTNLILLAGVLLIAQITPLLQSPTLRPAFQNLLPALFGALGVVYVSKNWKIAAAPLLVMVLFFLVAPKLQVGVLIPVGALVSIAFARILYKKGAL